MIARCEAVGYSDTLSLGATGCHGCHFSEPLCHTQKVSVSRESEKLLPLDLDYAFELAVYSPLTRCCCQPESGSFDPEH
jgi:hypothetical protein